MDPTEPMPVWELPGAAVDTLLAAAGPDAEVPLMMVEVPNAVAGRDAAFSVWALGPMAGPVAAAVPAITQSVLGKLAPWAAQRSLLNFLGPASAETVGRLWSDDDRARLRAVKRRVDPGGVFSSSSVFG